MSDEMEQCEGMEGHPIREKRLSGRKEVNMRIVRTTRDGMGKKSGDIYRMQRRQFVEVYVEWVCRVCWNRVREGTI